ncbi:hypothetical protein PMAYCL1PPCAC_28343, partial [Pristionchus mayeri]
YNHHHILAAMSLLVVLQFTSLAFSSAASISSGPPDDHTLAARQFYGETMEMYHSENYTGLFDVVFDKVNHFFPGYMTHKQVMLARSRFVNSVKTEEDILNFELSNATQKHIREEFKKRKALLTDEAIQFLEESDQYMLRKVARISKIFEDFHAVVDAQSPSVKSSLIANFPIFGKLDEVFALVKEFENILIHSLLVCRSLPGFSYCEKLFKNDDLKAIGSL